MRPMSEVRYNCSHLGEKGVYTSNFLIDIFPTFLKMDFKPITPT